MDAPINRPDAMQNGATKCDVAAGNTINHDGTLSRARSAMDRYGRIVAQFAARQLLHTRLQLARTHDRLASSHQARRKAGRSFFFGVRLSKRRAAWLHRRLHRLFVFGSRCWRMLLIEPLENRALFSASPLSTAPLSTDSNLLANSAHTMPANVLSANPSATRNSTTHNVVLIDSNLQDVALLESAVRPGTSEFVYDGATESADEVLDRVIAWAKENDFTIGSLSILAHGHAGAFALGNQWISASDLSSTASEWKSLSGELAPGAQIDLYGCDVAAPGSDGQELLASVAALTDATVFASTNLTGRGGDWILEANSDHSTGQQAPTIVSPFEQATLATYTGTLLSTFTVTNANDSGAGSLRQAIDNADSASGGSTINFNIAGSGVQTIALQTALPAVTQPVTINGTTEGGYSGAPLIEVSGASAGGGSGLTLASGSSGSTVTGLIFNRFSGDGLDLSSSSNDTIVGDYIGVNSAGSAAASNTGYGIRITSGDNDSIGGASAADRNIISGNDNYGIDVSGSGTTGNVIEGNYIGTDASGSTAISNKGWGVVVELGASNTIIGGATAGAGNLISGNDLGSSLNASGGVGISASNNVTVQGNIIGLNAAETAALPNGFSGESFGAGVFVKLTSSNVLIGGTAAGDANVIADNIGPGIGTDTSASQANISENSIYGNTGIGIDLDDNGITANNAARTSNAPNQLIAWPTFTSAIYAAGSLTVAGFVGNVAGDTNYSNVTVQIFISDSTSTNGSGETYLGSLTANSSGNFSGTLTGLSGITAGSTQITGTATDSSGNTSEFGSNTTVSTQTFTVTNVNDSGAGSLRQAMLNANASSGNSTILFDIPNGGVQTITPSTKLPILTQTVTIDGTSQPNYSGSPLIQLDGSNLGSGINGIEANASGCTIKGLAIDNFKGNAIQIDAANNTTIQANYLGIDPTGTSSQWDGAGIGEDGGSGTTIGGAAAADRNVISGNYNQGIEVGLAASDILIEGNYIGTNAAGTSVIENGQYVTSEGILLSAGTNNVTIGGPGAGNLISGNDGMGVEITGSGSNDNVVEGNDIGTTYTGEAALANSQDGVLITSSAAGNQIGGASSGDGNVISGNLDNGIEIDGTGSGNSVEGNNIGLDAAGTTALANNDEGIDLQGGNNTIGGATAADGNFISGNDGDGVLIETSSATDNIVQNNRIGTNAAGTAAVGNSYSGVFIQGGSGNDLVGNLISGNTQSGVGIYSSSTSGNSLFGNDIGTNAAVSGPISNNVGVNINGASNNAIGGLAVGQGNVIAYNANQGVVVSGSGAANDAILENSIYANGALGIDLGGDGVTANTGSKSSSLPNDGMNFPVFTTTSLSGSTLTLAGYVGNAAGESAFGSSTVEVFASDGAAGGHGQGKTYLGSLTTNANGNFTGNLSVSALKATDEITATAIDSGGSNTSEFSANIEADSIPTVATPASATPSPVTGTTTDLSVLGAEASGESGLTYSWTASAEPTGASPEFSLDDSNAAKNTTVTFNEAGNYTFAVTITDGAGNTVESSVNVTVDQTLTHLTIPTVPPAIADNETYPFAAVATDQFGNVIVNSPLTWSMVSAGAGGNISASGVYSTPSTGVGNDTIQVSSGNLSTTTTVQVTTDGIFSGGTDIGPPALPGYFSYSNGNYSVTGGDNGNNSTDDFFQFANTSVTGDAQVVAQVVSMSSTPSTSIAGVVLRDGTGASAISAAVFMLSNSTVSFQYRSAAGTSGGSVNISGVSLPQWVKLDRIGNVFSAFYSSDGTHWTQVGTSQTIAAPATMLGGVVNTSDDPSVTNTATFSNVSITQPTVATAAAATPNLVTGNSTALRVLGSDPAGEPTLDYTWAVTAEPSGANPIFDSSVINGTNASKNIGVTFDEAGNYTFQATITDSLGLSTTSSVDVDVEQTLTTIDVTPANPAMNENQGQTFTAAEYDQFGDAMTSPSTITWSNSGADTINSSTGAYTSPDAAGNVTVTATSGSVSGNATVSVTNANPTIASGPFATPSNVSGNSTTLSVQGADDGGEGNLTYTWSVASEPSGANATFDSSVVNGTNASKTIGVTFDQSGNYTFDVTLRDGQGGTLTGTALVDVEQTLTSVAVAPGMVTLNKNSNQTFSASASDQFGNPISGQTFSWSNSGVGSIDPSTGVYTAPASTGNATITATDGSISGNASVTVTEDVPTIIDPASASPGNVTGNSTTLSARGYSDLGLGNLTYTWDATSEPTGADPLFTDNHDNSAQSTNVTFDKAGNYTFQVTIADPNGGNVTSSVDVDVEQTLTAIVVTPTSPAMHEDQTQTFTAAEDDQFGDAITSPSNITWSGTGIGSIDPSSGVYTSPDSAGNATVTATSGPVTGNATITVTNANPVIVDIASATPGNVTGNSTALSVSASDDGGAGNLTYTWTATAEPAGADPIFSDNGNNSAQNANVTFNKAGNYTFQATITDGQGGTITSSVDVDVVQTLTTIDVTPTSRSLNENQTQTFTAEGDDQFDDVMTTQPTIAWSNTGIGSIDGSTGVYTAPDSAGNATVTATSASITGNATVSVSDSPPTISTPAKASPGNVTGNSTTLSAAGASDVGDGNLTYTWTATSEPADADPTFSINGTNAAQNTNVTFDESGNYTFQVTIADGQGGTIASDVNVDVEQTFTSIILAPAVTSIHENQTWQFEASALDQFNQPMSPTPTFDWSNTGVGSIDSTGAYTASDSAGNATVTVSSGGISASDDFTVTDIPPTISSPASTASDPVTGTSTIVSALGASDVGDSNLIYTWTAIEKPAGSNPIFADNGTNAAHDSRVTFDKAGDYTLQVTISDGQGQSIISTVPVAVTQTFSRIAVTPDSASLNENQTQAFSAVALDQFGDAMASQPSFSWSSTGLGEVDLSGAYTAPNAVGSATVTAASGDIMGSANVTVINPPPTIAVAAASYSSANTSSTAALSILGASDVGEANLTYTWAATSSPDGANPIFSDNADNSAKNTAVTFDRAGAYTFTVTLSDGQGGSASSSVNVTVEQMLTSLAISPTSVVIYAGRTQAFTANGVDQFGQPMALQSSTAWSLDSGIGSIDGDGIYTAPGGTGMAVVRATAGVFTSTANVTVVAIASNPTLAGSSPQTPFADGSDNPTPLDGDANGLVDTDQPLYQPPGDNSGNSQSGAGSQLHFTAGDPKPAAAPSAPTGPAPKPAAPPASVLTQSVTVKPAVAQTPPDNQALAKPAPIQSRVIALAPAPIESAQDQMAAAFDRLGQSGPVEIAPINKIEMLRTIDAEQATQLNMATTEQARVKLKVGLASALGVSAASAYFLWMLRGAGVLASLLSGAPVWKLVDPFFVLPKGAKPGRSFWRKKKKLAETPEERLF